MSWTVLITSLFTSLHHLPSSITLGRITNAHLSYIWQPSHPIIAADLFPIMPSLSTQSSKTSLSWPGHPMAAGSYMLQAAQEPILVTHTNFQGTAPPSRSCSANSDRARSTGSGHARSPTTDRTFNHTSTRNTSNGTHYRCFCTAAVLCALLAVSLLIAGLVFLLDGVASTSRTMGIILVVVAPLVTICAMVIWRYTCQRHKIVKEKQQDVTLKSVKPNNSSSYVAREIYL